MNVTYHCPSCEQLVRSEVSDSAELPCPNCEAALHVDHQAVVDGEVKRCVVCGSDDFFLRKDFPQRIGVGIVVVGLSGFLICNYFHQMLAGYLVLFATALLDAGLYRMMGNLLECYRCHAQHRDAAGMDSHGAFNLETHERYRQQRLRMRMAEAKAVSGEKK